MKLQFQFPMKISDPLPTGQAGFSSDSIGRGKTKILFVP